LKNKRPTWCHLLFYFTSYVLNMFWTLIYPSSGACNCAVELPHRSFCSWFVVCWWFGAAGFEYCRCCSLQPTQTQPNQITNTHRTKNKTTDVVIQQHSCKLLMMDILMSETCWVHKKWNKIASDIKFVFYSSTCTKLLTSNSPHLNINKIIEKEKVYKVLKLQKVCGISDLCCVV